MIVGKLLLGGGGEQWSEMWLLVAAGVGELLEASRPKGGELSIHNDDGSG